MCRILFFSGILVFFCGHILLGQNQEGQKEIEILIKKALVAKAISNQDSSLIYFRQAEKLSLSDSQKTYLSIIYLELAKLSRKNNNEKLFTEAITKSGTIILKDSLHPLTDEWYTLKAQFEMYKKNWDGALMYLNKVEQIRKKSTPFENWKTYRLMSNVHRNKGDTGAVKKYSEKAEVLAELQNTMKQLTEISEDGEFEMSKLQMTQIMIENALIHVQNEQQKNRLKTILSGLFFSVVLISILLIFLFQRNKWNRILKVKNKVIQKNLEEKEILVQEIHHRVKNNLQLISSLLSLQSRNVPDEMASQALHEGQSRVLSMALIHQNLYKETASSGMEVKDYVVQLTRQLLETYGLDPQKIKLDLDIDPVSLDVSTLVPLALIINELITNALKYAFDEGEYGNISMSLKPTDNQQLMLKITDNGKGFDFEKSAGGFGMKLIKTLALKLDAEVTFFHQDGTIVEILLKDYKKAV